MTDKEHDSRLVPLVGGLGIIMIAAGIVIATAQALRPAPATPAAGDVPAIVVLAPESGDSVDAPIAVRFRAGDRLALGPMGWTSDDLHLHAYLDSTEVMPAAADIERQSDGSFVWRIPAVAGARTLALTWAGMQHGAMRAGASEVVSVVVR
jgi:hypothetical protein